MHNNGSVQITGRRVYKFIFGIIFLRSGFQVLGIDNINIVKDKNFK